MNDISLKLTQEDIDFVQELIDNPQPPNEELVAAHKVYKARKDSVGSFKFNVEEK